MAKTLPQLEWIEELLPEGYRRKPMFGGLGYYLDEKMILVMFEDSETCSYKNKKSDYAIWNGCLFPAEKEFHEQLLKKYKFLANHPVLPKWLYLPLETEDFENNVQLILKELRRRNPLFGVVPKEKKKKSEPVIDLKIDTRRPRMFSDEPAEEKLRAAKKLTDLKNFGPVTEKAFHNAGIKTVSQFIKLGWQKTMIKLVKSNPRNRHSLFAYAVIGALKNQEFTHISDTDKEAAKELMRQLKLKDKNKKKVRRK